jgi:hypothetical protein
VIWYAAYGSNLSRARFDVYLRGGTPEGATHHYPGCRDLSAPLDDRTFEIDLQLAFGGTSQTWGGGVAFVRPGGTALARIYLITDEQFADVIAQENWLDPGSIGIDGGDYMYGVVPELGSLEGHAIRTITQAPDTMLSPPSAAYLKHIADGLREAYGMSDEAIDAYLRSAPGLR